jgi:acetylornithine deacetylase
MNESLSGADADKWRVRVLNFIDERSIDIVTSLRELVRIPSISGSDAENEIQAILAPELTSFGLDVDHWQIPLSAFLDAADFPGVEVQREQAWGLVGVRHGQGDGTSLMFNVHTDVVPPGDLHHWANEDPFSGRADASMVYGRGACDMKGGVVAAIWAVRALAELKVPLRGDVILASVVGEEDGGLGTYATLRRGWRADACVIPEPTGLDIVPANAGALTFRLSIEGLATHASRRLSGVSAVEKFWPVFAALRRLEADRNAEVDPIMARWDIAYPIEIGTVRSGDWSSSVPDLLVAEGRYGVALDETPAQARTQFEAAVAQASDEDVWLRDHPVQVQWWGGQFAPGRTDADALIVASLAAAHARVSDHPQQTWGGPYGSDLRLMTTVGGVPTLHYGPGDVAAAHSPRERVSIDEVLTTARTTALLAIELCGLQ